MLTTKETLDNLTGTEKVAVNILDRVRSLNDHLFGMNAPADAEDKGKSGEAARGFINQVNDQNADIVVVLTRIYRELQFMQETLMGPPEAPEGTKPSVKVMPKADVSGLSAELSRELDKDTF